MHLLLLLVAHVHMLIDFYCIFLLHDLALHGVPRSHVLHLYVSEGEYLLGCLLVQNLLSVQVFPLRHIQEEDVVVGDGVEGEVVEEEYSTKINQHMEVSHQQQEATQQGG